MTAKQKAVTSLETNEARINIGGISLKIVTPDPEEEEQVTRMIEEWYPAVKPGSESNHATNSWKSTSSKVNPKENFTNVTVNVTKVTLTNGKKRYDINLSYSTTVNDIKVPNDIFPVPETHPFRSAKDLDWFECYCWGSRIGTNSVTKIIVAQLLMNDEQLYQGLSTGQISSHLELVLNRYYAKSDEQLEKLGRFAACEYRKAIMTTKSYLINVGRRKPYTLSSYRAYLLNVLSYWE